MSEKLLSRIRKLNHILSESASGYVSFGELCDVMADMLDSNVYILNKRGKLLSAKYNEGEEAPVVKDETGRVFLPEKYNDRFLEITETAYTDSVSSIVDVVNDLRDCGFKVAMDDFGKGYSSLNMLTSLPIDYLKLDMAFIKDISKGNKEMTMVEFIINVANFLEVPVIAEGVETSEQYLLLKNAGCDIIQGYYFSKPLTASEFGSLIEKNVGLFNHDKGTGSAD